MIKVIQADMSLISQQYQDKDNNRQVMVAQGFGTPEESYCIKIRRVTGEALKTAEANGLNSLLLPVVNSRMQDISIDTAAKIMVSEVRRYLSLGSGLKEVTFALPDEEGIRAFQDIIDREKIVCLGDSITYGYPDGHRFSWTSKVAEVTGYKLINRGISGETTSQMLARFDKHVRSENPAYLIFLGGHNDGWQMLPSLEALDNIKKVVELALQNGICPILGLPSPLHIEGLLQSFEGTRQEAEQYEAILKQIREGIGSMAQEKGLFTLDFYTPLLLDDPEAGGDNYLLDGCHPNHDGYRVMGEAVIKQLEGRLHI